MKKCFPFLFLCLLLFSSCHSASHKSFYASHAKPLAPSLLKQLEDLNQKNNEIKKIHALAQTSLKIKNKTQNFLQEISIEFPTSFEFLAYDDLANPLFKLSNDKDWIELEDLNKQEKYEIKNTEKNLSRFLPFNKNLESTLRLAFGIYFIADLQNCLALGQNSDINIIRCNNEEWFFNSEGAIVEYKSLSSKNKILIYMKAKNHLSFNLKSHRILIPSEIEITDQKHKVYLKLHYEEIQL